MRKKGEKGRVNILQEKKDTTTVQRPKSKNMKRSNGYSASEPLQSSQPASKHIHPSKNKRKDKKKKRERHSLPLAQEVFAMKVMDDVVSISRVVKVDKAKAVLDGDLAYVAIVLEESLDVSVGGISREMAQVNTSWHLNVCVCFGDERRGKLEVKKEEWAFCSWVCVWGWAEEHKGETKKRKESPRF